MLKRIAELGEQNERPEVLYHQVAQMDTADETELEAFQNAVQEIILARQRATLVEVRKALLGEARTLVELWDAEAIDLDQRIEQGILELQSRQGKDLSEEFFRIEQAYVDKRPHFSTALLELFDAEPKMRKARAFNEALRAIEAGKTIERAENDGFRADLEREKSLKLSWKVCQQVRQMNGVVDKMQRHRRQREAQREIDKGRLKLRVHAAMQRLERDQREEVRRLRQFLQKHVFRVRKLVESAGQKHGLRPPLYEAPARIAFNKRESLSQSDESVSVRKAPLPTEGDFQRLVLGDEEQRRASKKGSRRSFEMDDPSSLGEGEPASEPPSGVGDVMASQQIRRPKSAPLGQRQRSNAGTKCDWCGRRTLDPCVLPDEGDAPSTVMKAMSPYDFPVALSLGNLQAQAQPSLAPKPSLRGEPMPTTQELLDLTEAPGRSRMGNKGICSCCSWRCCRLWNQKNSPPYLRTRRDLAIDLRERSQRGGPAATIS